MASKKSGAPVEDLPARAKRLVRLAPGARRVVGKDWFFDNRVEVGYLGETLVCLSHSFEHQEKVLDFIEAATPEVVKQLALKALAFDALTREAESKAVSLDWLSPEGKAAFDAGWKA